MLLPSAQQRSSKVLMFFAGLAFTVLVWAVDYLVLGPAITFTLLYLIPIAWVTWYSGRMSGFILALISTAGWFTVYATQNPHISHSWDTYLNVVMKIVLYLAYAYVFDALHTSLEHERELSRKDPLTGAANRRAFLDALELEKSRARRSGNPLAVAYFDIDNFKDVNDTHGHAAGDRLLRLTTETIRRHLRSTDILARMGGDEFAILFPDIGSSGAGTAVGKIHRYLQEMGREMGCPVTFSFGVLSCPHPYHTSEEILTWADRAMYAAKQAGKNRVRYAVCEEKEAGRVPVVPGKK